jgi:GNAT superfamily N-acetyltransferase
MTLFELATPADATDLTAVCTRSFNDAHRSQFGEDGGPPGYNDIAWHEKAIQGGHYYKMVEEGQIIGGMIVRPRKEYVYHLSPLYIDPAYHNRGIGKQAMYFLETAYPDAVKWTLDTPEWATRNIYFYEKLGYQRVRLEHGFVAFEKVMPR